MRKVNCVRQGIMSLIRVKDKGDIIKTQWLDLLHNRGYVEVDVTGSITPPTPPTPPTPEPLWFEFGQEPGVTDSFGMESHVLTKEKDGITTKLVWVPDGSYQSLSSSATKDGVYAGNSSVWLVFYTENEDLSKNILKRIPFVNITALVTSENSFEWSYTEDETTYTGVFSIETDAEEGDTHVISEEVLVDEEPADFWVDLFVKFEEE